MHPAPLWLLTYAGRTRATTYAGRLPPCPPRVMAGLAWGGSIAVDARAARRAPFLTPSAALIAALE